MSKSVVITGASRGIGKAIALKFAKEGYNIGIICKNNEGLLQQVEQEIKALGVTVTQMVGDISDFNTASNILDHFYNTLGSIDVLVNNAGISYIGLLSDMSIEDWHNVINTNLTSVFNTCHYVIPKMLQNKMGKIINISSVWGEVGASCEVAYSASKGGLNAFTNALGKELAPSNIQVNAIACGAIETDMNRFLDEDEKQALVDEIPSNRMGAAEEVADLVCFLASDGANYLTGQVIRLDGGWI
ncbi:3-oxoacyl-[acyl-carrier protein] reductase [Natranaerovirga pectinivora]|uniref:3-oxoacyl-[acyl-carrier protein] reductase n=1 Tax=Natranaerovirga pectinivora TaxID=682400 RepID=A0A4R3MJA7_9FIRM|nr:SDR family oxidoreductase [Natranaerovirga pectinivora]TCT14103.1 3-oxoacyl-[acyl-carrier protein] reductase [Natranaerovirga pectinivora]